MSTAKVLFPFCIAFAAMAQQGPARPALVFKEEWKMPTKDVEIPITQEAVANPNLELKLYGEGKGGMKPDHGVWIVKHPTIDEPTHTWSGMTTASWAFTLRDKDNFADLSGLGRIRWQYKVAGFHQLRPIIKLADGTWLAGDRAFGTSVDWLEADVALGDVRWRRFDVTKALEAPDGKWIDKPDLSKVDEIGFTDMMAGSGHGPGGWSDVGTIEVYGKAVKRTAQ